MTRVKICGITRVEDAVACRDLGADAIGLNFVASSPRRVSVTQAREISRAVPGLLVVGVIADVSVGEARRLAADAELGCLQLHGDETAEVLAELLPHAYKAVRIASAVDAARARTYPGEYLLVDAKVDGMLGGSGATFDWSLVKDLAKERRLTLAGGLTPANVAEAVQAIQPWCVDVASGVELSPGVKDHAAVAAFTRAAR